MFHCLILFNIGSFYLFDLKGSTFFLGNWSWQCLLIFEGFFHNCLTFNSWRPFQTFCFKDGRFWLCSRGCKGVKTLQGITFNPKSNVHVEHTWLCSLRAICTLCDQRSCGMPTCGPTIDSWSLRKLKNVIYCGNHHYLWIIHPYWLVWSDFNEEIENKVSPIQASASNTIKWNMEQKTWSQGLRNRLGAKHDLIYKHGIKWHNIMFKLPYWEIGVTSQNCKF
jgi:hypothetical protein